MYYSSFHFLFHYPYKTLYTEIPEPSGTPAPSYGAIAAAYTSALLPEIPGRKVQSLDCEVSMLLLVPSVKHMVCKIGLKVARICRRMTGYMGDHAYVIELVICRLLASLGHREISRSCDMCHSKRSQTREAQEPCASAWQFFC